MSRNSETKQDLILIYMRANTLYVQELYFNLYYSMVHKYLYLNKEMVSVSRKENHFIAQVNKQITIRVF